MVVEIYYMALSRGEKNDRQNRRSTSRGSYRSWANLMITQKIGLVMIMRKKGEGRTAAMVIAVIYLKN